MFNHRASCCWLLFCFCWNSLLAQSSTPDSVPTDPSIATLIKSNELTEEEKQKIFEYGKKVGKLNSEKLILLIFQSLPPDEQKKLLAFTQFLLEPKLPRTTVEFEKIKINLGEIRSGTVFRDSISLKNTGRNPYTICSIRTNCDCTVLRHPEFPVMPGETETIFLEFDSSRKLGILDVGIVIEDNSSPNLRTIIQLKGNVVPQKKLPGEDSKH